LTNEASAAEDRAETETKEEPLFTPEEVALLGELEQKHGRVQPLRVKGHGLIVFGKPDGARKLWKKYRQDRDDPRTDRVTLEENLQRACIVHPKGPVGLALYNAALDDFPGLDTTFAFLVGQIFGGDNEEVKILGKDWKRPEATT
jgi:hypothetical protein